jgi:error-prone DNA polymerase
VNRSERDHGLEKTDQGWAIRLGFRLVKGLSEAGMTQLVAQPRQSEERRFQQVSQLKADGFSQRDLEALASANALHDLSDNRYQTRWALMDQSHSLPLFAHLDEPDKAAEPEADYLTAPSELDNLVEDYASTGLTLNRHPITLLDEAGAIGRFTRAKDLCTREHKSMVAVAGVVTGRQSPGTAAGVTFITLEDDTGNSNVVVWLATARAQKQAYLTARLLKVHGILEREGEVTHVIAGRLEDLSHRLDALSTRSRDFH